MMRLVGIAAIAALVATSVAWTDEARPTFKTKFGILMPTSRTVLHPGWSHPNRAPPKESDWRIAFETTRLPMFMSNTGMLWGYEIEGSGGVACTGEISFVTVQHTFPDKPALAFNMPATSTYDTKTNTRTTEAVTQGCRYSNDLLFTPGDPVGRYKIEVWITGMQELKVGQKINGNRPPDAVFEFEVYEPAAGETNPSAFAHCGQFSKYDPKIVDCEPKLNISWVPTKL
jgi:hypothetical protein